MISWVEVVLYEELLEFISSDEAIFITINCSEGVMDIKPRALAEPSSYQLCAFFVSKVKLKCLEEHISRLWGEEV